MTRTPPLRPAVELHVDRAAAAEHEVDVARAEREPQPRARAAGDDPLALDPPDPVVGELVPRRAGSPGTRSARPTSGFGSQPTYWLSRFRRSQPRYVSGVRSPPDDASAPRTLAICGGASPPSASSRRITRSDSSYSPSPKWAKRTRPRRSTKYFAGQ